MLEEKRDISEDVYILKKRKDNREYRQKLGSRNRLFILGTILGLIILAGIYLYSPLSKVYMVAVSGNTYLTDDYYRRLSGVDDEDIFYFVSTSAVEAIIEADPLVSSVTVSHEAYGVIHIEVTEKKIIAYCYDDAPYLIDEDGEFISLTSEYYSLISRVPIIEGYDSDEIEEIARGFKNVDDDIIDQISEIHKYPFTYDERMMEVVMRSGNYVYVSYYGLTLLNSYLDIEANLDADENVCIFLDEITNSGYTSTCPYWGEEEEESSEEEEEDSEENLY